MGNFTQNDCLDIRKVSIDQINLHQSLRFWSKILLHRLHLLRSLSSFVLLKITLMLIWNGVFPGKQKHKSVFSFYESLLQFSVILSVSFYPHIKIFVFSIINTFTESTQFVISPALNIPLNA